MPVTGVRGRQILDDSVTRADINVTVSGSAVITRILQGAGLVVPATSTGADSGTGDVALTLGNSGATPGTYGSSTQVPVITVDQYGRITSVSNASLSYLPLTGGTITGALTANVSSGNAALITSGSGTVGGATYFDFLRATTTAAGATNPTKTFRLTNTGSLEIVNSAYSTVIFTLSDAGAGIFSSSVTASSIIRSGGTATQILAADGSVITAGTNITISGGTISATGGGGGGTTLNGTGFVVMSGTTPSYLTGTASQFVKADGTLDSTAYAPLAGATFTGQIISTRANNTADGAGQIFLNGTLGNRIDWAAQGLGAPTLTTRSTGTKLVLYPAVSGTLVDDAIGVESNGMWFSTRSTSQTFRFFGGTTAGATLTGAGALTLAGQLQSTQANNTATGGGQIYLNGTGGNRIDFNNNGSNLPTLTTRSAGTKIVFRPTLSSTLLDIALGSTTTVLWASLPGTSNTNAFRIYAGTNSNPVFTVQGDGVTFVNNLSGSTVDSTVITTNGYIEIRNSDASANVQLYNNAATTAADLTWLHSPSNRQVTWLFTGLTTTTRTYTLPNASGTMVLSVNGTAPDATGNVTIATGGGTTTNAVTFNNSGSGAASGTTFNGSAAVTVSHNTIGAQPLNTNLTSLGALSFASTSFVKMTAAGTFALDTDTYYLASNPNGYTSNTGTVTSVSGTGSVSGLTLTGTVTGSGSLTLGGTLSLTAANVNAVGSITNNTSGSAGSTPVLTASGTMTTQQGDGTVIYVNAISTAQAGLFASSDNSNSILTVNRHPGNYYSQFGFSSNGNLYYRNFTNTAINTSQAWQTIWTSTSLTNLNQLTNGPGYTSNTGTVTSVSGTGTVSGLTLSGTVTSSGSLTLGGTLSVAASNFSSQTANTFLAAPNGAAGVPTFRGIVAADIPTLNQNTTGSAGSVTNSFVVRADSGTTEGTDIYTFNGSAAKNINFVAGANMTITKAAGSWTFAVSGVTGSQWTTNGSNIHYNTGNVGIGATTPIQGLHILEPNGTAAMVRLEQTSQRTWDIGTNASSQAFTVRDVTATANRLQISNTGQLILPTYTALSSYSYTNYQGQLGFDGSGNIIPVSSPFINITFLAAGNFILNNMASALQFFNNQTAYIARQDLIGYRRVRLHVMKGGTNGATNAKLILRYRRVSDGFSTITTDYVDIGTSEVSVNINTSNTFLSTAWINLAANAQFDSYIALMMQGGDGAADPVIGGVYAEFDYRI